MVCGRQKWRILITGDESGDSVADSPALTWRNGYQTNLFFICNSCKHICTQDCDSSHAVYMYMLRGRHNSGRGGVLPVVYLLLFYLLLFVTSRTCRGVQGVSICPLRLSRVKAC